MEVARRGGRLLFEGAPLEPFTSGGGATADKQSPSAHVLAPLLTRLARTRMPAARGAAVIGSIARAR